MSHRLEIERHCRKLSEIRGIMDSMKTLAYLETHKLARYILAQQELVSNIDNMAADFLSFYPEVLPGVKTPASIVLIIGSQRGFCGNFNDVLPEQLKTTFDDQQADNTLLIAVGQKLHNLIESMPFESLLIEGANVAEEISKTAEQIARTLDKHKQSLFSLTVLYHAADNHHIICEKLLPPFMQDEERKPAFTEPPLLNLTPVSFLLELTAEYLFAALHRILYASLMAENTQRVQHLEKAVKHLDEKTNKLSLKSNQLRQEEIIEEIEVILLNASVSEM